MSSSGRPTAPSNRKSSFDIFPGEIRIHIYKAFAKSAYKPVLWADSGLYYQVNAFEPSVLTTSRRMKGEMEAELHRINETVPAVIVCEMKQLNMAFELNDGPLRFIQKLLERALVLDTEWCKTHDARQEHHKVGSDTIDALLQEFERRPIDINEVERARPWRRNANTKCALSASVKANLRAFLRDMIPKLRQNKTVALRILNSGPIELDRANVTRTRPRPSIRYRSLITRQATLAVPPPNPIFYEGVNTHHFRPMELLNQA